MRGGTEGGTKRSRQQPFFLLKAVWRPPSLSLCCLDFVEGEKEGQRSEEEEEGAPFPFPPSSSPSPSSFLQCRRSLPLSLPSETASKLP